MRQAAFIRADLTVESTQELSANTLKCCQIRRFGELVVPVLSSTDEKGSAIGRGKLDSQKGPALELVLVLLQFGKAHTMVQTTSASAYLKTMSKTIFVTKNSSGHMPAATRL